MSKIAPHLISIGMLREWGETLRIDAIPWSPRILKVLLGLTSDPISRRLGSSVRVARLNGTCRGHLAPCRSDLAREKDKIVSRTDGIPGEALCCTLDSGFGLLKILLVGSTVTGRCCKIWTCALQRCILL